MRRKKHSHNPPPPPVPLEEPFYTPFQQLQEQLRHLRPGPAPAAPPPATSAGNTPQALPPQAAEHVVPSTAPPAKAKIFPSTVPPASHEKAIFLQAMAEVMPLPADPRGRVEKPRSVQTRRALPPPEETDELSELRDFVEGRVAFTIQYTDEYMEGVAPGVDFRLAQRLHQGDYAVQAHYDLHGHTVEEAHLAVARFLTSSYATGRRCILLIHGRGHNSKDNRPVLKEQVQIWLSHGRLSRMVLAFATAPPNDGGAGAVCVLLRRAPHLKKKS